MKVDHFKGKPIVIAMLVYWRLCTYIIVYLFIHNLYIYIYTIWLFNIAMENHHFLWVNPGKPSINGSFSMAMLNNQRVINLLFI